MGLRVRSRVRMFIVLKLRWDIRERGMVTVLGAMRWRWSLVSGRKGV